MKNLLKKQIFIILSLCLLFESITSAQTKKPQNKSAGRKTASVTDAKKPLVTFIELGSVRCIPCKAMQKVMKSVEENYGDQIKIIFYDVWTKEQESFAKIYKIRLIPTQVFLDRNGKEIMRHEGFFPEKEIDSFLQSRGLKSKTASVN